jgi:acyl CoA:acetate/3-ketoacid CoA transferase alpha subunit
MMDDTRRRALEAAYDAGQDKVKRAIADAALSQILQGDTLAQRMDAAASRPPGVPMAVGFGALAALGGYMRAMMPPQQREVIEHQILAVLRGILRGAEGPVGADGTVLSDEAMWLKPGDGA